MGGTYCNEFDPQAAAWLRQLAADGLIQEGTVDERSIKDVGAVDVVGRSRAHFFAGIGGWELALQLAGWPADRPVWTGSCPCQPYSSAGKQKGNADERDLWPDFFRLIRECRPECVFGEQVEGAVKHGWLDRIHADLEGEGYTVGACVLGAHSVGAPHIRQRLYWVAHTPRGRAEPSEQRRRLRGIEQGGTADGLADPDSPERGPHRFADGGGAGGHGEAPDGCGIPVARGVEHPTGNRREPRRTATDGRGAACGRGDVGGVGDTDGGRFAEGETVPRLTATGAGVPVPNACGLGDTDGSGRTQQRGSGAVGEEQPTAECAGTFSGWRDSGRAHCRDGKTRRVPTEPGLFPLAHGIPNRVALLRGAGNAIVPQTAALFIKAFLETEAIHGA